MTSKSDIAISVQGLSKSYTIAHNTVKHTTAAEALVHWVKNPFRRTEQETFWALKDVSFDVQKGDVVGIIGRNGAGKSTLLKVLSRITEPSGGKAILNGRVGSLLEVGTGFHPELTGRENIYMNGAILGMTKREIAKHFDAIVEFAGVAQFLDTPVKRYSSGMYIRLAFAVAAHLNPEILIVDEVLAVGDAEFQKKCLGKMKDVAESGRTVLFVSHNMQAMSLLCNRGILLVNGKTAYCGDIQGAVSEYLLNSVAIHTTAVPDASRRPGSGEYRILSVDIDDGVLNGDQRKVVTLQVERRTHDVGRMFLSAHIVNEQGAVLTQCDSRLLGHWIEDAEAFEGNLQIDALWLKPGAYRVDLFLCASSGIIDAFENACTLNVSPIMPYPFSTADNATQHAQVLSDFHWQTQPIHKLTTSGNKPWLLAATQESF